MGESSSTKKSAQEAAASQWAGVDCRDKEKLNRKERKECRRAKKRGLDDDELDDDELRMLKNTAQESSSTKKSAQEAAASQWAGVDCRDKEKLNKKERKECRRAKKRGL